MARKRKAAAHADDHLSEHDEIQVASTRQQRGILHDMEVQQAQNKRRRIADCVVIPVSRETRKLIADAKTFEARSRRQSTRSQTPSISDSNLLSELGNVNSTPQQMNQRHAASRRALLPVVDQSQSENAAAIAGNGRPRRSSKRVSYIQALDLSDDSADEISEPAPPPKRWKVSKAPESDYSEFEEEPALESLISDDDFASEQSEETGDTAESESDSGASKVRVNRRQSFTPKNNVVAKSSSGAGDGQPTKTMSKQMKNLTGISKGLDLNLPPLHDINDIFADIVSRAMPLGLDKAAAALANRRLRVATMCSGTESPLLAIEMIRDNLKSTLGSTFDIEHLFSAEIEPFKQAYIERNFNPPIIFRDITELVDAVKQAVPTATTAYGGKADIPREIDIVIAGTSCVDASQLNSHRKTFEERGESGDTWYAVLNFCQAFRPAIVVLENVKTAQWDQMLQDYKDAGYEPAGAYVDTKNYYIPQTRQRGYMVCFDQRRLRKAAISSASENWKTLMEKLQRRASSPVSSFLLPSNDIPSRPLQINENANVVDWSKCEITQMDYRLKKRLGVQRPLTHWSESGSILPPDYGDRAWHGAQVERVLDTLDAATLRKARDGYDARFKTRVWDLSQNIHFSEDSSHFGLIRCITPTGINFVSDAWRAMTPEECLALQGIPLSKISFTVETNGQIQSLAGNAMSGPLVGCAILSSIISGYKVFESSKQVADDTLPGRVIPYAAQYSKVKMRSLSVADDTKHDKLDVTRLHRDAKRASRRCYCEGPCGMTNRTIQQCTECGHTTCVACGGNPEHHYSQSQSLTLGRITLANFEEELRAQLPLQLRLQGVPSWQHKAGPVAYYDGLSSLATTFSLSGIRRSHCIRVLYTSPKARLELHLEDHQATWYAYVDPSPDLAVNAGMRETLSQPVARSQAGESLLGSPWSWRSPVEKTCNIVILGKGRQLPTWWARMQMPDYSEHRQWEWLEIKADSGSRDASVSGTYRYLPKCGTACESLYKRVHPEDKQPLYLFLDPSRVGPSDEDCFVFARKHARMEYDENRHVLGRLHATWRPWTGDTEARQANEWSTTLNYYQWTSANSSRLVRANTDIVLHKPADLALAVTDSDCQLTVIAISASVDLSSIVDVQGAHDGIISLEDHRFFSRAAWIFEAMRRRLPTNKWHEVEGVQIMAVTCGECSPEAPALRWKLDDNGSICAYEDPRTAAAYELSIKNRRPPVVVQAKDNKLILGINLATLAHRARARLHRTSENGENDIKLHWRLCVSAPNETPTNAFSLTSTRGIQPHDKEVQMSVKLYPNQCMALAWMKAQETGLGRPVLLEESAEAPIPALGWRIELRAQKRHYAKGGICADHPGFGKTITSLALIHTEWLQHGSKGLNAELGTSAGIFTSSATVVVCPKMLVKQWAEEAREKWRSDDDDDGICVVESAADLAKHTIVTFRSAKLIIVSRETLASDAYTDRLAALAAMPGPANSRGRAYSEWLKHATKELSQHLTILREDGRSTLVQKLQKKYHDNVRSENFLGYVPSKRLKGKAYAEAASSKATGKTQSKDTKSAAPELQTSSIGQPLFEMFLFNRLIVDEFHSSSAKDFQAISAIKADKRWGLSGTPPHSDCYDVARTAQLLNVPLRFGSIQRGFLKLSNIKTLHDLMTPFEKFEAARASPTASQNDRIHELAQDFLDMFVRRNVMDVNLSVREHLVPVTLSLVHHATYHELSQHLNSSDMKIRKSTKRQKTDRDQKFADAVDDSATAEDALSNSAACPRRVDAISRSTRETSVDDWIVKREDEAETLTSQLGQMLGQAYATETEEYLGWRAARVDANQLGDGEVTDILREMCREADKGAKASDVKAASKTKSDGKKNKSKSKRELTSTVNKLVDRLLSSKRSARYLQNVKKMQALASANPHSPKKCDHPECHTKLSPKSHVAVSGFCGHLVCSNCHQHMRAQNTAACPVNGCTVAMAGHHLLWNSKLHGPRGARHTAHGAKLDATMEILRSIRDNDQQAVLFVQYDSQLEEVENACADARVPAVVVKSAKGAGQQIAQFQEDSNNTVIVLNATSQAAEGLNLQFANNVIFLSPLLRDSQYHYESTMAQAIGRVRRHGQKKDIHVYRIVALNTIDVDILEHRERRTDALVEEGEEPIVPPQAVKVLDVKSSAGEVEAERTQLVVEEGRFSLRPQSWLIRSGSEEGQEQGAGRVKGRHRVEGWEDFSSLVKFSRAFTEDDD